MTQHALKVIVKYELNNQLLSKGCADPILEDMDKQKKILIIAGPNGAGKTTFAIEFLPREAECPNFINADLIAAGIR